LNGSAAEAVPTSDTATSDAQIAMAIIAFFTFHLLSVPSPRSSVKDDGAGDRSAGGTVARVDGVGPERDLLAARRDLPPRKWLESCRA
jgi:hypothetical protein